MAVLPIFRNVTPESLGPDVKPWFIKFLPAWNIFGHGIYNALNHQLTGKDNFVWTKYPTTGYYSFTTPATYNTQTFIPIKFNWPYPQIYGPNEVRIGYIAPQNGAVMTTNPGIMGCWSYDSTTATVTINYITGLAANTTYNVWFIAE